MRALVSVIGRTALLLALELALLWACFRGQPQADYSLTLLIAFSALIIFFFVLATGRRRGQL
ncbi:MAG TPA: hypothetical protein VGR57_17985 [Ktedonobacterales bacterium]|nr:hypothetical protein [Ktedonobacterales bacterium]